MKNIIRGLIIVILFLSFESISFANNSGINVGVSYSMDSSENLDGKILYIFGVYFVRYLILLPILLHLLGVLKKFSIKNISVYIAVVLLVCLNNIFRGDIIGLLKNLCEGKMGNILLFILDCLYYIVPILIVILFPFIINKYPLKKYVYLLSNLLLGFVLYIFSIYMIAKEDLGLVYVPFYIIGCFVNWLILSKALIEKSKKRQVFLGILSIILIFPMAFL